MLRDDHQDTVFYFAGGGIEEGESDMDCLKREIKEELDVELNLNSVSFLGEFEAPAHVNPNALVNIRLYTGQVISELKPSNEIVEIQYFDSSTDPKNLTRISREKIFPWLKKRGYIN